MGIKSTHPQYDSVEDQWCLAEDCYEGEDAIKKGGQAHLPATSGQIKNGANSSDVKSQGRQEYDAYKLRAVFPDIYREAVEAAIGTMHRKPANIELPAEMESLRENATALGESLQMVIRNVNVRQLVSGRLGLLGDVRKVTTDGKALSIPQLSMYYEKTVRNWDDTLDPERTNMLSLVVLDESGHEMKEDMEWDVVNRYKVLALGEVDEDGVITRNKENGTYMIADFDEDGTLEGADWEVPERLGSTLNEIPFVFINSKDIAPTVQQPPLYGLAKLCLVIYRGEADYRQHLFMQGQETLVRIGHQETSDNPDAVRTGAGAVIDVPLQGDAKFIGVNGKGLSEQREALKNDYNRAADKGGKLLDTANGSAESGEALRLRISAQTVTLPQLAVAACAGIEQVIKALCPLWNANPDEVIITPNLDFTDDLLNSRSLVELMSAKEQGAPISLHSIHAWLVEQGATDKTFDEEIKCILEEEQSELGSILDKFLAAPKEVVKPAEGDEGDTEEEEEEPEEEEEEDE